MVRGREARDDVEAALDGALGARAWVWAEGLAIDSTTRAGLLEPIVAVEDGLREVVRRRALGPDRRGGT